MTSAIKKYWSLPAGLLLRDADYLLTEYGQTLTFMSFDLCRLRNARHLENRKSKTIKNISIHLVYNWVRNRLSCHIFSASLDEWFIHKTCYITFTADLFSLLNLWYFGQVIHQIQELLWQRLYKKSNYLTRMPNRVPTSSEEIFWNLLTFVFSVD
jgi:hypothetical protein